MWNFLSKFIPIVKELETQVETLKVELKHNISNSRRMESSLSAEIHTLKNEVKRSKDFQMMYNQKVEENKEHLSKLHWYAVQMKLMETMIEENKSLKAHIIQLKIDNQSLNEILSHKTV